MNIMMMGRELKRVPLNFDAPIGETWSELILPDEFDFPQCPTCSGDGMTPEARVIHDTWYAFGAPKSHRWCDKITQAEVDYLLSEGRLTTWVVTDGEGKWESLPLTAKEVNAAQNAPGTGLTRHDGINSMLLFRYRCERLGITINCPDCDGHGDVATPEQREALDSWRPPLPPQGDGWQLWQTISEGGPVSPVFETAHELVRWLTENETVAGFHYTFDEWLRIVDGEVHGLEIGSGKLV